jgi:hypothetical protein
MQGSRKRGSASASADAAEVRGSDQGKGSKSSGGKQENKSKSSSGGKQENGSKSSSDQKHGNGSKSSSDQKHEDRSKSSSDQKQEDRSKSSSEPMQEQGHHQMSVHEAKLKRQQELNKAAQQRYRCVPCSNSAPPESVSRCLRRPLPGNHVTTRRLPCAPVAC